MGPNLHTLAPHQERLLKGGHTLRLYKECREPKAPALLDVASFLVGAWSGLTWGVQGVS